MKFLVLVLAAVLVAGLGVAADESTVPPKAGPVEILKLDGVKPGMQATAWTAFQGSAAEPVPVEIIGILRNVWGPGQDMIMAKLGGKAARTNVAAGMSGSPVYYEGKLLGAIAARFSTFSPDAIAGITPIELMLEIQEFDHGRPLQASLPDRRSQQGALRGEENGLLAAAETGLAQQIWRSVDAELPNDSSYLTPIETPLTFSGVHDGVLDLFSGYFRKAGVLTMQGGAVGGASSGTASAEGALRPGEPLAAVLISGDTSASALGTVTYNDGKRVLGFGHAMFNLGPLEMPMARADVLTVLASQLQPIKVANSADIVGALRQDRHSGILGVLGESASMIPVRVKVRSFSDRNELVKEKTLRYNVFQNQKWTPPLMVFTLYNSMFGLNDFAQESTFRLMGRINLQGDQHISLETMQAATDAPIPAPLLLAGWVGDKFQRLFTNPGELPKFEEVDVTIELLPERRITVVEQAWLEKTEVRPGEELQGKVFLRRYRGERIEKPFKVKIPLSASEGQLRLLISDAATLDRGKRLAVARNRLMNLAETVSLLNQERTNSQLYITLMQPEVTAHLDDKTLPNVPLSVLNVLRGSATRRMVLENQSPLVQAAIPFDSIVSGNYSIQLQVK